MIEPGKRILRNGNPQGDPNSAPRCGARRKYDGQPCQAPAMANGRCRMHGGKSTGPRTPEGLERSRKARWKHGRYAQDRIDVEAARAALAESDERIPYEQVRRELGLT